MGLWEIIIDHVLDSHELVTNVELSLINFLRDLLASRDESVLKGCSHWGEGEIQRLKVSQRHHLLF